MRYSVNPATNLVVFHFKVVNITKFLLENLTLDLEVSSNLRVRPFTNQSNHFNVKSLSTREHATWSVEAKVKSFIDCTC